MAKTSYADLQRQIDAAVKKQREMEDKAAAAFTAALMKSPAKVKLVALSEADVRKVAKYVADNIDELIAQVQKPAEAPAPAPAAPASAGTPQAPYPTMQ